MEHFTPSGNQCALTVSSPVKSICYRPEALGGYSLKPSSITAFRYGRLARDLKVE